LLVHKQEAKADEVDEGDHACCAACASLHAKPVLEPSGSKTQANSSSHAHDETSGNKLNGNAIKLIFCGIFSLLGLVMHLTGFGASLSEQLLSAAAGVSANTLASASQGANTVDFVSSALSLFGAAVGLWLIAPEVISAIKGRRIDINILMVIAVIGACILGDFSEAAIVVFLFSLGEWIEGFAIGRNRDSIKKLMELSPQKVLMVSNSGNTPNSTSAASSGNTPNNSNANGATLIEVSPEDVSVGAIVVVRPGSRIPLDGIVTSGQASVDESSITGESIPVQKSIGSQLFSGTLSVDGKLEYEVTATVQNSTLARIVALVAESQSKRSPAERFINKFARYYTPIVVLLAAVVAIMPPLLDIIAATFGASLALGGFDVWVYRALSLLVIGCPCALVIATPVSVVCGLARAARCGILVKGGAFLELGASIKAVAFDKTGTLTHGKPEVVAIHSYSNDVKNSAVARNNITTNALPNTATCDNNNNNVEKCNCGCNSTQANKVFTSDDLDVLSVAYALERDSTHPLARAVVQAWEKQGFNSILPATDITEQAGKGISGVVDGSEVFVGSLKSLSGDLPNITQATKDASAAEKNAGTVLTVMRNNIIIGLIVVRDILRDDAAGVVSKLGKLSGYGASVMLSGDNLATANAIAALAQINECYGELLPQDKQIQIEQLRKRYGTVAMVGDGINDAPALAAADIGIAMGAAGSDTALEVADVALLANSLEALPRFFVLSRKVMRTIRINIAFALTFKIAVMALAIVGLAGMWMAIVADVGVLLLVLLHSMMLLRTKL
jgi:Cd2+/Zn2+-exporting ATPase